MSAPRVLRDLYQFARAVVRDYKEDNGSLIAAAISFYTFLSLIPLLLLCISVTAFFLGSLEQAQTAVLRVLNEYYPGASTKAGESVYAIVKEIVVGRATVTWLSSALLLWSGLSLMNSLSKAINVAWDIVDRRGMAAQKVVDTVLFLATLVMLGISMGLTAFIQIAKEVHLSIPILGAGAFSLAWTLLGYVVPLVVTTLAFLIVYKIAPNTKVNLRAAAVGALFSGVLWEMAKVGFSFYISHWVSGVTVYGSLGGVILLLMWINYSSMVAVLGAEVASEWQRRAMTPAEER